MAQTSSMEDYNKMESPRIQSLPGFYGDQLIDGVVIRDLTMYADERGFLFEMMRLVAKEKAKKKAII